MIDPPKILVSIERKTPCDICRIGELARVGVEFKELAKDSETEAEALERAVGLIELGATQGLAVYLSVWCRRPGGGLHTCDKHHEEFAKIRKEMEQFNRQRQGGAS
jgi:hypothetical protein